MSETRTPVVYVVDDDEAIRETLCDLVRTVSLDVSSFDSGLEFLEVYDPGRPGCLILDIRMPGMSGLEVHQELAARGPELPIIILTGHADVPMAVQAMKIGAFDFVEKPFRNDHMLDQIQKAVRQSVQTVRHSTSRAAESKNAERLERLTVREHQVLNLLVDGETNKVAAHRLGISEKTVETHRAKIMRKLQAKSLADLMRKARFRGV